MKLIDADKLKIGISEKTKTSSEVSRFIDIINEQPTAYDVDSVCEELEEELKLADKEKERCIKENPLQFDSAKGYANGIANAIEIVRSGAFVYEANNIDIEPVSNEFLEDCKRISEKYKKKENENE